MMFWAFIFALALHFVLWIFMIMQPLKVNENDTTVKFIEVSLITKNVPIIQKQKDDFVVPENPPAPIIPKLIQSLQNVKKVSLPKKSKIVDKKNNAPKSEKPTPKDVVHKSEIAIRKAEKLPEPKKPAPDVHQTEKPHLSLETLQQQIAQVGSETKQQVNERDKYIRDFSAKAKRIGQEIYDRGTLPAGVLETRIEIDANGMIVSFKITRSSGNKKLDEAVENMVHSGSPYPDLSFQLLSEAKTLVFLRVWEFYGD